MASPAPSLGTIDSGLRTTTERIAAHLATSQPDTAPPTWSALQWQLATAAAAAHGVSGLLDGPQAWPHEPWRRFLREQREHVACRFERIATLLSRIDGEAKVRGLAVVALKGAALHAQGMYSPGERPMADIDLLVAPGNVEAAANILRELGYRDAFEAWRHRVFHQDVPGPGPCLGEHRDTPINVELHTRVQERLPVSAVDITESIFPTQVVPGLNPYRSRGALMAHLLLHAAGNMCNRSLRLIHVHDLQLLAARMSRNDWEAVLALDGAHPWWAFPPLQMVARYYRTAVPEQVLARFAAICPPWLRYASHRHDLTRVSCSHLWLQTMPGIEWSRTPGEALSRVWHRLRPTRENARERADMARTQLWLQGVDWVTRSHLCRLATRLLHPVPRIDTLYVVRQALAVLPES